MIQSFIQWLAKLGPRFQTAFVEGDRWKLYLQGLGTTLEMTALALVLGIILGLVVAVVRTAHDQQRLGQRNPLLSILNALCKIYTTVLRGTPMMVQLLIWSFVIFASSRNKNIVGILGLNYLDTMRFIVIPQAFKNILPSLGNEFITLFKDTSLVNAIGGFELVYYAQSIGGRTFDYMPPYIGIAIMYLVVVIILTWLQGKLERRLRQSDRR